MRFRDFLCLMVLLTMSSSRLTTLSLDQVSSYNTEGMTCEQFWEDQKIHQNLLQWQKAYDMHESGQLQADLDVLYELRQVVKEGMEGDISFLEQGDGLKQKLKDILKKISEDPNQLGSAQKAKIRQHVQEIIKSDGDETPSCCALLFGLVEYLMSQMENMQNQCQQSAPPTRIKISGKIDRIEVLRAECGPPPPECRKHKGKQKEEVKIVKEPEPEPEPNQRPRRKRTSGPPQSNFGGEEPQQQTPGGDKPDEPDYVRSEEEPEKPRSIKVERPPTPKEPTTESEESVSESYDSTSEEESYEEEPPKVTPPPPEPTPVLPPPPEPVVIPPKPEVKPPEPPKKEEPEPKQESPPPLKPAPQVPQGISPICVQGNRKILEASHQGDPLADVQIHQEDLNDVSEYSVAMWLRFLTRGGQPMYRGMIDPWYFVFRLANRKQYANVQLGDRVLTAFIGPQAYQFSTYDMRARNPSVNQFLKSESIEAQWSYVYFGYSRAKKIARVWFQNDGDTPQALQFRDVWHEQPNFLRLVIGGTDLGLFPGFNGQITSPVLRVGNGAYLETISDIELYGLKCNPQPKELCGRMSVNQVVQDYVTRDYTDPASKQFELNTDYSTEYAIAGWFKWQEPAQKQSANSIFRVTINNPDVNSNSVFLGDRVLFAQWAREQVQLYTYTYHDMRGVGNPSIRQPLVITDPKEWFFVYMAYSRDLRQAYAFSMQNKQKNEVTFYKVNHYVANKHYVQVGSDKFFPSFNGQLTYVDYLFCKGAYNPQYKPDLIPFVPQPAPPPPPPKVETPPPPEPPKVDEPIAPEPVEELEPPSKEEPIAPPSKFPEPPQEEEAPIPIKCVEGSNRTLTAGSKTVVDSEIPVVKDPSEYGFGFWFRFLTRYPRILQNGLASDTYFMARVTSVKDYSDQNIGDRLLLVTQEAGAFRFYSDDQRADKPAKKSLSYQDIEGQWIYVYFSHHVKLQRSTGFLFHDGLQKVEMTVIQPTVDYIRLVIGGADLNKYQAFNGQVSRPVLKLGKGAYIANEDQIAGYAIVCNPQPVWTCDGQSQDIIEEGTAVDATTERDPFDVLVRLPEEYSVVGWFKWNQDSPNDQALFRLTINKDRMTDAKTLGDRALNAIVSDDDGGSLFLSTYSYTSLTGDGDPNVTKRIQVDETLQKWFFMYFGYSRKDRVAFAKLNVGEAVLKIKFDQVNHFISPIFRLYVGNDPFRRTFPGQLSGVKVFFCEGAYTTAFPPVPPPPFPESQIDPTPIIQDTPVPEIKKTCVKGADITLESSELSQSVINATVSKSQLKDSTEYGYGYWLKFMTRYPQPLINGLEDHQYFISRLSKNDPYKNLGFGDRMLGLWQTQDGFLFVTNDLVSGSANVYKLVENDGDIEGVWQYIYFSYSRAKRQAVGMIQRQGGRTRTVEFDVTHPVPLMFKFILGGSDLDIYPGFNGIFAKPVLRIGSGSFLADDQELQQYSQACNNAPILSCPLKLDFLLIDEPKSFVEGQSVKAVSLNSEDGFPQEYSVAGWFRWNGAEIFPWHLLFRLTINNESINRNNKLLGDRVLAAWLGGNQGGSAAIATYTYQDIKGNGNPNILDVNKLGLQNLIKWNHFYAGYSALEAKVYASVWNGGDQKIEFKLNDIHHYEAKTFYMYVAGDQFYRAFAGQITRLNAHLCLGAYTTDYPHGDIPQLPVIPPEVPKPVNPIQPPQQTQDDCITIPHKEINLSNVDDVIKYLQETKNQLLGNQNPSQEVCYCTYFTKEQPSLLQIAPQDPWLKVVI